VADAFEAAALRSPDRPFVVFGHRRLTYAQVGREAAALAAALADVGVGTGDRIATALPNRPEAVTALLAAARLGATLVPLNPALTFPELHYQLRHADVAALVAVTTHDGRDFVEWFQELVVDLPDLRLVAAVGAEDLWLEDRLAVYADLVSRGARRAAPAAGRDPAAIAVVLPTSGTTGKPKGVCLSHRAAVTNAAATAAVLGLGPDDRVLLTVPAFTVFGTTVVLQTLLAGGTLVLLERFTPAEAVRLMGAHGVTVCHGVPTTFALLLGEAGFTRSGLPTLRTGLVAGGPVAPALVRRIRAVCDVEIAYGLTETGPTVSITRRSDPPAVREETVGRPLEGVVLQIVDEHGVPVAPGQPGELTVRSPWLMAGYDRMPAETRRAGTPDGALRTGDVAVQTGDGALAIVGRRKETIIRGGYNVHPREVEDVLRAHPAVAEVAVVGVPHEVLGEMICACIVPTEGAEVRGEELLAFARTRMADYKVPDAVRAVDALPLTATGKVQRHELARRLALDHSL
jgi:fatty-acyl-CoA synthase